MSCYSHLTIEERESLMLSLNLGKSIRAIARELHRSPSTISRELRRNQSPYHATAANKNYEQNRKRSVRKTVLSDKALHETVHFLLGYFYWSPEQISNRLRYEGKAAISTSTIYRALDNGELQDTLRYYLRLKYHKIGKSKKKARKCFKKSISLRPIEAYERKQIGHFEGDTVHSSNENECLVTLVDRASRYLLCARSADKGSENVSRAIVELLTKSKLPIKSVTFDQGTEFAESARLEKELNSEVYYAHPHSPWERPTNENTNGLIRQFAPKRSKLSSLSDADIDSFTAKLNLRPRKCLGWKTPYEVAFNEVLHLT